MSTHATPEHSPLGKTVSYQDQYDKSLLFPIARQTKRDEIGVEEAALPFAGVDIWTGFELSWLNAKGKPQVAIATFRIPAASPRLIESKSFKLYLNSYNQTRMDSADALAAQLARDLSEAAGAEVSVSIALPQAWRRPRRPGHRRRPLRALPGHPARRCRRHRQRNAVQQSVEVQLPGHRPA